VYTSLEINTAGLLGGRENKDRGERCGCKCGCTYEEEDEVVAERGAKDKGGRGAKESVGGSNPSRGGRRKRLYRRWRGNKGNDDGSTIVGRGLVEARENSR
jgi:hypothetical protein